MKGQSTISASLIVAKGIEFFTKNFLSIVFIGLMSGVFLVPTFLFFLVLSFQINPIVAFTSFYIATILFGSVLMPWIIRNYLILADHENDSLIDVADCFKYFKQFFTFLLFSSLIVLLVFLVTFQFCSDGLSLPQLYTLCLQDMRLGIKVLRLYSETFGYKIVLWMSNLLFIFVPYFIIDKNIHFLRALSRSFELITTNFWPIFITLFLTSQPFIELTFSRLDIPEIVKIVIMFVMGILGPSFTIVSYRQLVPKMQSIKNKNDGKIISGNLV